MSKIFAAIEEGRGIEYQAIYRGNLVWVVDISGRLYTRIRGDYYRIAKKNVKPYFEAPPTKH